LKEPRFGAIDVHVLQKDGRMESKIVNFRWSPDTSKVQDKMKYAGSEGGFKGKVSAAKMLQANDAADITIEVCNQPTAHSFSFSFFLLLLLRRI
jgi:cofilin